MTNETRLPYATSTPATWKVVPLKYLTRFANGFAFKPEHWRNEGTPILRIENLNGSENFNYSNLQLSDRHRVLQGDLLYSWSGNPGTSFGPFQWRRPGPHYLNQHIYKLFDLNCDKDWLYWTLKAATHWVERELTSGMIGMVHVTKEELGRVPIPIPSIEEQRQIADYLDKETSRIDRFSYANDRLLERLAERRTAAIIDEVSGGGHLQQRRSTLAWLRYVPDSWDEVRVGLLARMGSGHTPSRSRPDWWQECTIPWITTGEVQQVRDDRVEVITETREQISEVGLRNSAAELHPKGTVILCRTASAGYSAVMGVDMATSQDFVTWTCGPRLNPFYLLWCLRAMRQDLLGRLAMGSTHKTIYVPDLQALRIPLPPTLVDQVDIVRRIRANNERVDQVMDRVRRQSKLLAKRRQALITAAVTGQFDVSTASGRGVTE
ncbi:restriction endonuclease subunit S [Actinomadura luteofluorescens]|uniref:restriction endonuclease subunit S n=1 Tax=Actinomadura luteofluorescens TaxID=46163 RepID=UPI0030CEB73B